MRTVTLVVAAFFVSCTSMLVPHPDPPVGSAAAAVDAEAAPPPCTQAEFDANDERPDAADAADAAPPHIEGPTLGAVQFTPHCITIKQGQSVSFTADFSKHPLRPVGGDANNPIQTV